MAMLLNSLYPIFTSELYSYWLLIKNYDAYQRYLHIIKESNGDKDRLLLGGCSDMLFI